MGQPDGWMHKQMCVTLPVGWCEYMRTYGVVVSMFDFHRSDRGSNPGRGGKIS